MPNEEHRSSPSAGGPARRFLPLAALIALAILGLALLVIVRGDKPAATAPSPTPPPVATTTATTIPSAKTEVTARLVEILQIRERAFAERDAGLFDDVYTSDCSCLQAGRAAIAALEKENIRWRNRSISVEIESAKRLNNRLWEILGLFISHPFRIETEQGDLVREAPAERIRYRFLLVRSSGSEPWRLGSASPVKD